MTLMLQLLDDTCVFLVFSAVTLRKKDQHMSTKPGSLSKNLACVLLEFDAIQFDFDEIQRDMSFS